MTTQAAWAMELPKVNVNAPLDIEDASKTTATPGSGAFRGFPRIIGESAAFRGVLGMARIVAPTDSTVLINGETGTGKELIAGVIHHSSARSNGPFVKMNCAAIPAGLLESELFGHERGAFTGAVSRNAGRFERADRGTLFLDEIGDIPLELQPKLLRVIQEKQFERLGGAATLQSDVRVICATHRNLAEMVEQRQFRADLFYRLSVFPIELPPLRDRVEDIPLLVHDFATRCATRLRKPSLVIAEEFMEALVGYSWPGNVRELQNVIERAVILATGTVLNGPMPDPIATTADATPVTLRQAEQSHILQALQRTKGVIGGPKGAAVRLGLPRTTLLHKMRRLGIHHGTGSSSTQ